MGRRSIIKHEGIIQEIKPDVITVRILNHSACAGCHIKSACTMADVKEKFIEVANTYGKEWNINEKVIVSCREEMGFIALFWAYLLPFITVTVTLLICTAAGLSELYSGLISLGILIPYYAVLSLFKKKLSKRFTFYIEKI